MADDEFVIGFSDSEWTGIAPLLEEDVAISSLAQDELGHAAALYTLLAEVRADGRDADAIAYDRQPDEYRHARLLDHGRGDWAMTIARRYLYDTADGARLEGLASSSFVPLRELVDKIRREERYHVMHATAWLERLAAREGEPRDRLLAALEELAPDAATVFTPLAGEDALVESERPRGADGGPRGSLAGDDHAARSCSLGLPMPPAAAHPDRGRTDHREPFRWLWTEFTSVRRSDPVATW